MCSGERALSRARIAPKHELVKTQMSDFGGIVTLFIEGDLANTCAFLENSEIFALAESLAGYPPS